MLIFLYYRFGFSDYRQNLQINGELLFTITYILHVHRFKIYDSQSDFLLLQSYTGDQLLKVKVAEIVNPWEWPFLRHRHHSLGLLSKNKVPSRPDNTYSLSFTFPFRDIILF